MEAMSLNALVRPPLSSSSSRFLDDTSSRHFLFSNLKQTTKTERRQHVLVVEAKGKKGMMSRQYQRPPPPPPLPKIEDTLDRNVAAKDNFLGKYIYKDTLDRNVAAVIYKDEKEIQKSAFKQYRVLRSATDFRYGYKLVENTNIRAALSTSDVIELPTPDKLKTVVDKVKDFFGDAKESFGKITALGTTATDESEEDSKENAKV